MRKKIIIFIVLTIIICVPFFFQKANTSLVEATDDKLVIITPHNEDCRYEFTLGFKKWYFQKTGRTVSIDWRVLSGSQEIFRLINTLYANAFELYWERVLRKEWSEKINRAFSNGKITLLNDPELDTEEQFARRAFLNSNVTCGIDILFGGGDIEVREQANRGNIVASEIMKLHPDWFADKSIPNIVGGIHFWDDQARWVGNVLGGFGIIFNREVLSRKDYPGEPQQWSDLANEAFWGEVALADPTISASSNRIFDMMFQQQVHDVIRKKGLDEQSQPDVYQALEEGWGNAMRLIQQICANARYFTDSSTKPVLDVSSGDCAAGVAIDFYGLYQEENLQKRSQSNRFGFIFPRGGSIPTADVMAMLRGAPNPEVALAFIEYVLSLEGQKLWSFKTGTPGGPSKYALRKTPIRKEIYSEEYDPYRSNPELNVYRDVGDFIYHSEWSTAIFKQLRFVIKVAFVDTNYELSRAWKAIIDARKEGRMDDADRAFAKMQELSMIGYEAVIGGIKEVLESAEPLEIIKLQGKLTHDFRKQYEEARIIAKGL